MAGDILHDMAASARYGPQGPRRHVTAPPSRILRQVVGSRCRDVLFSLLCGSHATGNAHSESDVDMLVVERQVFSARRMVFQQEGYLFDLHIHDPETLTFTLAGERRAGPIPTLHMVAHGKPFGPADAIYEDIHAGARAMLAAGPTDPNWILVRHQLTELLSDLAACESQEVCRWLAMSLYREIINAYLLHRGRFPCEFGNIARSVQKLAPAFASLLTGACDRLFIGQDAADLLTIGYKVLQEIGGPLTAGFSFQFPAHFRAPAATSPARPAA